MKKLINPVPNAISVSKSGYEIKITSTPNSDIIAPYDGKVEGIGNSVRIKHSINGKKYYSDIENIGKIMVSTTYVRQGEKIGETGSGTINYKVLDNESKKVDIDEVFKEKKDLDKDSDGGGLTGKDIYRTFSAPITIPLSLLKRGGKSIINALTEENVDDREININEEIERIKNLMK
jgi:hypothetical protein